CAEKRHHDGLVGTQPTGRLLPRQRSTLLHHHMRESVKWKGRWYLHQWPSQRAMKSIRARIRQRTDRRYAGADLKIHVEQSINPVLRGWGTYFRIGNSSRKFSNIDCYVRLRLARLASVKYGLSGINWGQRFDYAWARSMGVYELVGSISYQPTHALR
ncbi:MAG: group II intron maturase-specific domain-containing protein, partial [Acidimicrobiales bacterium]